MAQKSKRSPEDVSQLNLFGFLWLLISSIANITWAAIKWPAVTAWKVAKWSVITAWDVTKWAFSAPLRLFRWFFHEELPEFETVRQKQAYLNMRRAFRRRRRFLLHQFIYGAGMVILVGAFLSEIGRWYFSSSQVLAYLMVVGVWSLPLLYHRFWMNLKDEEAAQLSQFWGNETPNAQESAHKRKRSLAEQERMAHAAYRLQPQESDGEWDIIEDEPDYRANHR